MWKEVVVAKYTALISHYFGLSKNIKKKKNRNLQSVHLVRRSRFEEAHLRNTSQKR